MQALIVHDDISEIQRIRLLLARRGYDVLETSDQAAGVLLARRKTVDLLILKLRIGDKHTSSVALAAEYNNPDVATVLLADGERADLLELFELIPSVKAILPEAPDRILLAALMTTVVDPDATSVLLLTPDHAVPMADVGPDLSFVSSRAA